MPKKIFSDEEIEKARKKIAKSISSVGGGGFLTEAQVKALQKKLRKA